MKKCPKTITGKHYWNRKIVETIDIKWQGILFSTKGIRKGIEAEVCHYCGIVDDRTRKPKEDIVYS